MNAMHTIIEYTCCVCGKGHQKTFPVKVNRIETDPRTMVACKACDMVTPHAVKVQ